MTNNIAAPKLLLIDTCGEEGSLALAEHETVRELVRISGKASSERLLPELREALARLGWSLAELAAISVVHGPGSFTGIRVGLSTAKGLAEATGLPLLVLSRLEAMAARATALGIKEASLVLAAGKNEVFRAFAEEGRVSDTELAPLAEVFAWGKVIVCEETLAEVLSRIENGGKVIAVSALTAADGLALALKRLHDRQFTDAAFADALYLRRTEQEMLERQARHRERRSGVGSSSVPQ